MRRLVGSTNVATGTGVAQLAGGAVDELLQASTKERREIFDEAAGISRFKAKKLETLRKLMAGASQRKRKLQ